MCFLFQVRKRFPSTYNNTVKLGHECPPEDIELYRENLKLLKLIFKVLAIIPIIGTPNMFLTDPF